MVGARAVNSQIAAEAGPVGEGPFFPFSFEKKIILCFFVVRFGACAKAEEADWCEPHRPHQQLGWFPNFFVQTILLFWLLLLAGEIGRVRKVRLVVFFIVH